MRIGTQNRKGISHNPFLDVVTWDIDVRTYVVIMANKCARPVVATINTLHMGLIREIKPHRIVDPHMLIERMTEQRDNMLTVSTLAVFGAIHLETKKATRARLNACIKKPIERQPFTDSIHRIHILNGKLKIPKDSLYLRLRQYKTRVAKIRRNFLGDFIDLPI